MAKKAAKKKAAKKTPATKTAATKKPAKKKKAVESKTEADGAPVKKKKAKTKRKSRAKKDIKVRQRLAWGVFNHAMKPVAKYSYNQKKAAEKKARELSPDGKPPHFVAKIKEEIASE